MMFLQNRSRRNNLRIDGLQETPNETWKTCEGKVQEILKNNIGFATEVEIARYHRVKSRNQSGQHQGHPRTIICRFNKFKAMSLRKTLWEKVLQYRRQNKFACLNYRSIIVRDFGNIR